MLGGDSKVLRLDSGVYILSVQVIESKVAYAVGVTAPLLQFSNVIAVDDKGPKNSQKPGRCPTLSSKTTTNWLPSAKD